MLRSNQVKSRCKHDTCCFKANIIRNADGVWSTRHLVPHGCEKHTNFNRRYGRTAYFLEMLSDLLIPRILEGLALSAQDMRPALRPFLRRDDSPSFLKRVREAAFADVTQENRNVVS